MGFLSREEIESVGFRSLGTEVRVSDRAVFYSPSTISIGDHSRIDDFCVLAGDITIGRYVHLAVFSNLAAGRSTITLEDFAGLAFGCHLVAQSDDYSGRTLTNPTVPNRFKVERSAPVSLGRHVILGTATVVLPGVTVAEGTSTGANSVVNRSTEPWSIYVGAPARRLKERSNDLLDLEQQLLAEEDED